MKKIGFFGLVLAFIAMAIFIVSCSQPLFPDGSTHRPPPDEDEYEWDGEDIPGWNDPDNRKNVAAQLAWLRTDPLAVSGTHWNVWAWEIAPYEAIYDETIEGYNGAAITVNLLTYSGYEGLPNRRTLVLGGTALNSSMLNVQNGSRLYLGNIILQGRSNNHSNLVIVSGAGPGGVGSGLEKRSYSVIRGNTGDLSGSFGVDARAGTYFTMRGNSRITGNHNGVIVTGARFNMMFGASITSNSTWGVVLQDSSTLTMSNSAHISGHAYEGLLSNNSRIYMYNNAQIRHNANIAQALAQSGATLNNSSVLIMRNNAGIHSNSIGIHLNNSDLFMYEYAAIHNNAYNGVRGNNDSSINMYDNASIHSNNNGGVHLQATGSNRLNMHGSYVKIRGNNSGVIPGGVELGGNNNNNELNISGGTIYGRYASGSNLQEPPELRNTGVSFHAVRSYNGINLGTYSRNSNFGQHGTFTPTTTTTTPPLAPIMLPEITNTGRGTNYTVWVRGIGENENNSSVWRE